MIEIVKTSKNTGLNIKGDSFDLNQLKEFLYKFSNEDDLYGLFIARKASYGQRLNYSLISYDDNKDVDYYGFNVTWPDWIFFLDELLNNITKKSTNQLDHSILSTLKYYTEKELVSIDASYGQVIFDRLSSFGIIKILQETILFEYLDSRVGKKRFDKLFDNLQKYSEYSFSKEKDKIMAKFQFEASKLKCTVDELSLNNSLDELYENIKW